MAIMTHAKFHFNWLMLTLIFGVWASEPPAGPGERLKRPGLIGLRPASSHGCVFKSIHFELRIQMFAFLLSSYRFRVKEEVKTH